MHRRLPAVLLVVAITLAITLAGAGATVAVVRSSGHDDGPPDDPRRAVVGALALRPRDVDDSARYIVRYRIEGPDTLQREVGSFEGSADFQQQRFLARARFVEEEGGSREFDSFVFSEWEYTRSAGAPEWRRRFFDPDSVGAPTPELGVVGRRGEGLVGPAYADDVEVRRQIVDALVSDVVPHGREQHRGTAVWRYRATVDGARAAGRLPEPVRKEMASWEEGNGRRDVDLWLDGRGRPRKISIFYDHLDGRGFRVENEFWDWGRPGRLDLPSDLGDATAAGGEGESSFTMRPGVELGVGSPSFGMSVFDTDKVGEPVTLDVDDRPSLGGRSRQHRIRLVPAAGRHLEPGEYRLVDLRGVARAERRTFHVRAPEIDERCRREGPMSGTLTVSEVAMYQESFYVRLHVRFTVRCEPSTGAAPVSFEGEARYHALT
jgi:hypothetical protein